ncbi:cell division protein FtsZ [Mycoplasma sp. Mirounga ES2805-ORL]|uniref:cell division protein FtsZ n=1 Tax=Mycoplasma sp. Mirounga ES2805-ORL TaxID=754514 RepID=UPI00197C7697|nr:cell division protein FtsZ [Mycoplasma sp. Mirounga ES2805-ORL]QSF13818.1 cell division FtsZ family protein [Mycoplasma sp. Mirounga ES2805-ORL]
MQYESNRIKIKIIGVGGAGTNMINLLSNEEINDVELFVANTDYQDLNKCSCPNKIFLGGATKGFGAGGDPKVGRECALDSIEDIKEALKNTDVLIVAAGLGGGTGTGAAPVICEEAKKMGILVISYVTIPFETIEGKARTNIALDGLMSIEKYSNSYMVLSNETLVQKYSKFPFYEALRISNITLKNTIKVIRDIVFETEYINLDFNDLKQVLNNGNKIGVVSGVGNGQNRAEQAVVNAFNNNLFLYDIKNTNNIIINLRCDKTTTYEEIAIAKNKIDEIINIQDDSKLFFGIQYLDSSHRDKLFEINVVAANLNSLDENSKITVLENRILSNLEAEKTNSINFIRKSNNKDIESNDEVPDLYLPRNNE